MPPFGVPQIVAAVAAAGSVLDAGCASARLTLALVEAGAADVVGIDTSLERLAQGRARLSAHPMGAHATLMEADFDHVLPFSDGRFRAAVSRLALMIASDPVVTLRELRRVTAAGGRIVTALWAPVDANPWFALPRAAAVVGPERADYARAFGRLGDPEQATAVHRAAGLADVQAETLRGNARRLGRRRTLGVDDRRERSRAPSGRDAQRLGTRSRARRARPAGRRPPHT